MGTKLHLDDKGKIKTPRTVADARATRQRVAVEVDKIAAQLADEGRRKTLSRDAYASWRVRTEAAHRRFRDVVRQYDEWIAAIAAAGSRPVGVFPRPSPRKAPGKSSKPPSTPFGALPGTPTSSMLGQALTVVRVIRAEVDLDDGEEAVMEWLANFLASESRRARAAEATA